MELDPRCQLLRAALGFLSLEPRERELRLLHRCFGARSAWDPVQRAAAAALYEPVAGELPSAIRIERRSIPARCAS